MPDIQCRRCGAWTNTALADHIESKDDMADACYAKYVNGKWERGCEYIDTDPFTRRYVDSIISQGGKV